MRVLTGSLGDPAQPDDKLPQDKEAEAAAEAAAEAGRPAREERLRVWPSFASTRFASKRVQLESHLSEPTGERLCLGPWAIVAH